MCLEPFEVYPGAEKLCYPCQEEIDAQKARMLRNDFHITPAVRAYLAAFDRHLRGDPSGWVEMRWRLVELYAERGVTPPAHLMLPSFDVIAA